MDTKTKTNQAQGQQAAIIAAFEEMESEQDISSILQELEDMCMIALRSDLMDDSTYRKRIMATYITIKDFLKKAKAA